MDNIVAVAQDHRREGGVTGTSPLQAAVVEQIVASLPELEQDLAEQVVSTMHGRTRRVVHDHLTAHPDALVSGSSLAPPAVQRLIQALADAGVDRVQAPTCHRCRRVRPLTNVVEGGRVCAGCFGALVYAAAVGVCRECARTRPLPAQGLCSACYGRGRSKRASKTTCEECGQTRVCQRSRTDGRLLCNTCRPRPAETCALCDNSAQVMARWPVGPVCVNCYARVRNNPAPCSACGTTRALIGRNGSEPICGPCAGTDIDYVCKRCAAPAGSAGSLCDRCALPDEVAEFFGTLPAVLRQQLRPLADWLRRADEPRAARSWLKHSDAARLLAEVASCGAPLIHEALDAVCLQAGRDQVVTNLRDTLVDAGVLPPRDEHLTVVERRFVRLIAKHPEFADHLRAYGYGSVLPRLRERERPATEYVVGWATARMSAAIQLLAWARTQGLALDQVTQEHVDQWLAEGPSTRHNVRDFMVWAAENQRAQPVLVPHRKKPAPVGMRASTHWGTLQRCLRDETLPLEVRVAGAIVLFYGQQVSRVVALQRTAIRKSGEDTSLLLGETPVPLPPPLARLITELAGPGSNNEPGTSATTAWLFPHPRNHTRHQSAASLTDQLNAYGIDIKSGRATALMNAALGASVDELSAKLGIHRITAAEWKRRASKARTTPPTVPPHRTATIRPRVPAQSRP